MCGSLRFTRNLDSFTKSCKMLLQSRSKITDDKRRWTKPGKAISAIVRHGGHVLKDFTYGMEASWANRLIYNARKENLLTSRCWTPLFLKSTTRCVIPVDSFLEWRGKKPYEIKYIDERPFALAGLMAPSGTEVIVITTVPGHEMGRVHHRAPAVLSNNEVKAWLAESTPANQLLSMLMAPANVSIKDCHAA